jgi:hypothetical protein
MGCQINSLADLPICPKFKFYFFVINGGFQSPHFEKLHQCFWEIAKKLGYDGAIVDGNGYSSMFYDEVSQKFLGRTADELYKELPALLVTDAHPDAVTEKTFRLLMPLKRAQEIDGDLPSFFRRLVRFARTGDRSLLADFEDRNDWFETMNKILEIKPGFAGFFVNANELFRKCRERIRKRSK